MKDNDVGNDLKALLLDHHPIPVIFVDRDVNIIFSNASAYHTVKQIFNVDTPHECLDALKYVVSLIQNEILDFKHDDKRAVTFKKVIRVRDVDYFFKITINRVFDEQKNIIGKIIAFEDNTENTKLDALLCMDIQLSEALNDLAKAILQSMTIDDISVIALENAKRFTNSQYGFAGYIDPKTGYLIVPTHTKAIWNECEVYNKDIIFKNFTGLWGWVLKNKKPLLTNEPENDPRRSGIPQGHVPIKRFLAVPSLVGDTLVGTLAVANSSFPYQERELEFLERISSLYALAVQHKLESEKLEQKNIELKSAYEELASMQSQIIQQEKLASIGQIAAGIAHEINNPIGYIISNLNTLTKYVLRCIEYYEVLCDVFENIKKELDEERRLKIQETIDTKKRSLKIDYILQDIAPLLKETNDGAERVKKIISDLKFFARTDEKDFKQADINAGIDSTINIIWNELKYKAKVFKEYGDIPTIKCNIGQLNQVFMNILVNAAHAIQDEGEIRVKTWADDKYIYVEISDTGCGIPDEIKDKIFNPFFTTKERGKGTGLGLSIAMDIVKKHNGEILVESTVGKGTTFIIKLPLEQDKV
ncbi:MAG: ATP-binding protein [Thermodesulfovibrionales bacterium]|nr:ATP-binding protein [Thermodesulfovibrionales bacterium]